MEGGAERLKRSFGSEEGVMHMPQAWCGQWEGADRDLCLTWGPGHKADPWWVGGCPSQCPRFFPHDLALSQTSWHAHTLAHAWILPRPFTHKDTQSCISQRVPGHAAVTSIPSAPSAWPQRLHSHTLSRPLTAASPHSHRHGCSVRPRGLDHTGRKQPQTSTPRSLSGSFPPHAPSPTHPDVGSTPSHLPPTWPTVRALASCGRDPGKGAPRPGS